MSGLVEPFTTAFMQRALVAGLLVVVATSLVGTWVVVRGMTFLGDALAHGIIPGIAVASLVGFNLTLGAVLSAAVMIAGIRLVTQRSRLSEDAGIGLLFVGMLAIGVIVISRSPSFTSDLTSFLFGDVLGVKGADLRVQAAAAALVAAGSVLSYRPFLALSFNPDKAATLGLAPRFSGGLLLVLVTGAIVASFQAVGTLLVFGLLVGPPATMVLFARRVPVIMVGSLGTGAVAVTGGLLVSYHLDTAAGATMAGLSVAMFFLALLAREVRALLAARRRPPAAGRPADR
ncbi:MAG: zinc ABC transporter permease AztB [Acidimicrobiales bacterium]